MDKAVVLKNALSLISIMDLAGIKGSQASLVAETIAGLHRLVAEASGLPISPAVSDEIAGARPAAVAA